MQRACGYFGEDEVLRGYLRANKGRHPAVRFAYRPMTATERAHAAKRVGGCRDPILRERVRAEILADRLVDWDLQDRRGAAVPIEVAILLRVEMVLLDSLFRVAAGLDASDEEPAGEGVYLHGPHSAGTRTPGRAGPDA